MFDVTFSADIIALFQIKIQLQNFLQEKMNLCYIIVLVVSTLITISEGRYLYDGVDYQPFQWFQPKYINSNPQIHGYAGFYSNYYPNQYHAVNIPSGTFSQPAYNFGQPPVYLRNLDDFINYYKHLNQKIEYDIDEMIKYPYRPYPFGANALDAQWNSFRSRYFPQLSTNDNESTNKPEGNSQGDVSTKKSSVTTEKVEETTIIETTTLPTTTLPTTTLPTTTLPTTTLPTTTLPTTTLPTTTLPTTTLPTTTLPSTILPTTLLTSSTDNDENKIVFDEGDYVDYKPKMITDKTEIYDEAEDDYNYSEEEEEPKIEETATEKPRGLFGFF